MKISAKLPLKNAKMVSRISAVKTALIGVNSGTINCNNDPRLSFFVKSGRNQNHSLTTIVTLFRDFVSASGPDICEAKDTNYRLSFILQTDRGNKPDHASHSCRKLIFRKLSLLTAQINICECLSKCIQINLIPVVHFAIIISNGRHRYYRKIWTIKRNITRYIGLGIVAFWIANLARQCLRIASTSEQKINRLNLTRQNSFNKHVDLSLKTFNHLINKNRSYATSIIVTTYSGLNLYMLILFTYG
jgi:hypothetical protein